MINKIKNVAGETITEVLVATLVVALGAVVYSMMVTSSFRIINQSEKKMQEYYAAQSELEKHSGTVVDTSVSITADGTDCIGSSTETHDVELYVSDDVASYILKEVDD